MKYTNCTWVNPKRHLDRFIRFCTAHPCAQQTDIQIHRPGQVRCDICSNRPHLCSACMWCDAD